MIKLPLPPPPLVEKIQAELYPCEVRLQLDDGTIRLLRFPGESIAGDFLARVYHEEPRLNWWMSCIPHDAKTTNAH